MQPSRSARLLSTIALLVLSACQVQVEEASPSPSGAAGSGSNAAGAAGATAGAAGSNTAGMAPAGGQGGATGCPAGPPCGAIPEAGVCEGNKLRFCLPPAFDSACAPVLREIDCGPAATCAAGEQGGAQCKATGACKPGDSRCSGNVVQTCRADGSGFDDVPCALGTECKAAPGKQATCEAASSEATGSHSLKGCVKFERHGMDKTGPTGVSVDDAWYQFVAVYNGSNYVGSALTGPDGCFDTSLTEPATESTVVYIYTIDFDADNQPVIGLVRNTDPSVQTHTSNEYWHWSSLGDTKCNMAPAKVTPGADGKHTMETMTIPEACGSGAIRIFQWVRYAMLRTGPGTSKIAATNTKKQDSVAIFWEPGVKSDCGSCFLGKNNGQAVITPAPETTDHYTTLMQFSGSEGYPSHWSYSAQSQMAGLWTLSTYGRMSGEGGQHFLTKPSKPGVAFNFGWATAFAQRNTSVTADDTGQTAEYDPLYIDTQAGTTFWVDISKLEASNGTIQMPDATQGIDQPINEFVVASMIWRLWQPQAAGEGAYRGLGDEKIFQALTSPRVTGSSNRGYETLDLIDLFDAASCTKAASNEDIDAVSKQVSFPWDASPTCN